jgi:hypothetical protein
LCKRHIRRHPAGRRSGLHRCSVSGRTYGNSSVPVAGSSLEGSSRKHSGPSWLGMNSIADRGRTPPGRWHQTQSLAKAAVQFCSGSITEQLDARSPASEHVS